MGGGGERGRSRGGWTQPCVDILDIYREFATLYTKRSSRFMSRGIPIYDAVTLGHCCHSHSALRTVYMSLVVLEFYAKRIHFTGGGCLSKNTSRKPLTWLVAIKLRGLRIPNNVLNSKRNKGNVVCFRNYLVNDDA